MSTAFRKGELVVMQYADYFTEHDGCLGVVVSGLNQFSATDLRDMKEKIKWGYDVKVLHLCIQRRVVALPHQLRRLKGRPDGGSGERSKREIRPATRPIEEVTS